MTTNNELLNAIDQVLDERSLEWAARWIQDSLKGETDERVIEFGNNMAMTLRAAAQPVASTPTGDLEEDNELLRDENERLRQELGGLYAKMLRGELVDGPAATGTAIGDEIDEVQHRADEVVNAAIEWHQSGREGDNTWFDKSEALGAAIDRLLELRELPQPHESDVDKWKRELTDAGWIAESAIAWRSPGGGLWRGPYGAWEELQRQIRATASAEAQDERE